MDYLDDGSGRRNAPNRGKSFSTKAANKIKVQKEKRDEQRADALGGSSDEGDAYISKQELEALKRKAKQDKEKAYLDDQSTITSNSKGKKHYREEQLQHITITKRQASHLCYHSTQTLHFCTVKLYTLIIQLSTMESANLYWITSMQCVHCNYFFVNSTLVIPVTIFCSNPSLNTECPSMIKYGFFARIFAKSKCGRSSNNVFQERFSRQRSIRQTLCGQLNDILASSFKDLSQRTATRRGQHGLNDWLGYLEIKHEFCLLYTSPSPRDQA
eukprot:TRINITY_DN8204_c0_g1_i2.p1 TRINITY_DN8204_c0_g1~~TRINITY_DN8204_c0_g1_i2.p1  ORF type:complete len:271 (+),score=6.15 TRINITY_DN8204_c0_g1_i2:168-980(+)